MTRNTTANFFRTHGPVVAMDEDAVAAAQPGSLQGMKMKGSDRMLLQSGLASPKEDSKTAPGSQDRHRHRRSASAKAKISGALAAVKRAVTRSVRTLRFRTKSARVLDASSAGVRYTPTHAGAPRGKQGWTKHPLDAGRAVPAGGPLPGQMGLSGDSAAALVSDSARPGRPEVNTAPDARQHVNLARVTGATPRDPGTNVSSTTSLGDNGPNRRDFSQPKQSPARVMIPGMGSRVNILRGAVGGPLGSSGPLERAGSGRRGLFLTPLSSRAHLLNADPAAVLTPSGVNVSRLPSTRRFDSNASLPDGTAKFIISQLPPARQPGRGSAGSGSMRLSLPSNDDISDTDVLGRSTSRSRSPVMPALA